MANTLKVTLVKSPIGAVPKHKKTVEAMGLTKMHKTVEMPDNAATRGMISRFSICKSRRSIISRDINNKRRCQNGIIKLKTSRRF